MTSAASLLLVNQIMRRSIILTSAALTASALQKKLPLRRPVAQTRLHAVARESQWQWQDNTIRYASEGPVDGPPVLFLHRIRFVVRNLPR